jgi:hypothetical protein
MNVVSVRKGRTVKTVTLAEVTEVNDEACIEVALTAARETRGSLHGINVTYFGDEDSAVVSLFTD